MWLQTSFYIKTTYNSGECGEDPLSASRSRTPSSTSRWAASIPRPAAWSAQRRGGSHIGVPIIERISNCDGECAVNEVPPRAQEAYAFTGNVATARRPRRIAFPRQRKPQHGHRLRFHGSHIIGQSTPLDPDSQTPEQKSGSDLSRRHRQERLANADADPDRLPIPAMRPAWCSRKCPRRPFPERRRQHLVRRRHDQLQCRFQHAERQHHRARRHRS